MFDILALCTEKKKAHTKQFYHHDQERPQVRAAFKNLCVLTFIVFIHLFIYLWDKLSKCQDSLRGRTESRSDLG